MLGIITKNTILKAIHNVKCAHILILRLGIITKNTILKAIHNIIVLILDTVKVGNYN